MIGRTNTGGGGGGSLNFKVVAAASEAALPTTAKENTIAVITDAEITSWVFSSAAPETPEAGMVWIATGTDSTVGFNAVKKNGLWVYPSGVQQYIGDEWVDKTAKTWQNGAWADWWDGEMYTPGNEQIAHTGGWIGQGRIFSSAASGGAVAPTITRTAENLIGQNGNHSSVVRTANAIDMTPYTTLNYYGTMTSGGQWMKLFLDTKTTGYWQSPPFFVNGSGGEAKLYTIDISSAVGNYYINFGLYWSQKFIMEKLWLE